MNFRPRRGPARMRYQPRRRRQHLRRPKSSFQSSFGVADAPRSIRYIGGVRMTLQDAGVNMSVRMPEPDSAVLARRAEIVAALSAIVPGEGVIANEREMRPYESDVRTAYRPLPFV